MSRARQIWVLTGLSVAALAYSQQALAQAKPATQNAPPPSGEPAQTAPASNAIPDIIVTAQKSNENVQRVASTVTVVSGDALVKRGVTDIRDLTNFAPMTSLNQEDNTTQVFIRGIGQAFDTDTNDPAVSVNLNQVYVPRFVLGTALFDIQDVQILDGPQGTLYGRNAAGGTVNITTRTPGSVYAGNGLLEVGNYGEVHGFAAVDLPLSDTLRLRAAVDIDRHNGYLTNGTNAKRSYAGRLTAVYTPTDRLTATVRFEYEQNNTSGFAIVNYPFVRPDNPWYQAKVPGVDHYSRANDIATSAEIAYKVSDDVTLTYIPGYTSYYFTYFDPAGDPTLYYPDPGALGNPLTGFAGSLNVYPDRGRQLTNELRLSGSTQRLKWVAGLYQYYLHIDSGVSSFNIDNPGVFFGGPPTPELFRSGGGATHADVRTKSYAAFGQATFSLSERARLTAGGRYSDDKKTTVGASQAFVPIAMIAFPVSTYNLSLKNKRFDWKVGAEIDVGSNSHAYGNIQTGYIGGGFNTDFTTVAQSIYAPETLLAYSAGIKNSFLGGSLHINDEVFYYDYKDLQVSALNFQTGASSYYNVPKSRIFGNQLDITYRVSGNTTLGANIGYLNAKVKRGVLPPVAQFSCLPGEVIPAPFCQGSTALFDYAGSTLPNAPTWSATLSLSHLWQLPGGSTLEGLIGNHVQSSSWAEFANIKGLREKAYSKTDVTLTFAPENARWTFGLWVKNLENTARVTTPGTSNVYGLAAYFIDPPRTFGARVTAKIGR